VKFPGTVAARVAMCAALAAGLAVGPAASETLTDALVSAYNNSDLLDQQRAILRSADEDVAQAVSALRPAFSYELREDYQYRGDPLPGQSQDNFATSLDLILQLDLYTGGRNRLSVEARKEAVLAAREALVVREQEVLLSAVQAYMRVFNAIERVQLQRNSVRLLEEEVRAARDRFEVGEVTRTDVAQAEARLAGAQASLVAAEAALVAARENYNLQIGRYPGTLAPPPPLPAIPGSVDAARNVALRGHPSILQAQRQVTVSEINVATAEAAVLPTLSAQASAGVANQRTSADLGGSFDEGATVGLSLSGPIYQGGSLNSVFRQARAQRDNSRAVLLRTTSQISERLGFAWSEINRTSAQLVATDREIEAAQIAFDGTREEATLGARTTLDVLDSEQDLLNARTGRVDAAAEQQIAYYGLLSSMGRLTADYLGLPVTAYDPSVYYNSVRNAPAIGSEQGIQLDRVLRSIGKY